MTTNKRPPASILFIFGGSGDLNYRKLTPALYNLFLDNWMPEKFAIAGIGRSAFSNEEYHTHLLDGITKFSRRKDEQNDHWDDFGKHVSYLQMDGDDAGAYHKITDLVKEKEISEDEGRRATGEIDDLTKKYVAEIDANLAQKEKDLMAV